MIKCWTYNIIRLPTGFRSNTDCQRNTEYYSLGIWFPTRSMVYGKIEYLLGFGEVKVLHFVCINQNLKEHPILIMEKLQASFLGHVFNQGPYGLETGKVSNHLDDWRTLHIFCSLRVSSII